MTTLIVTVGIQGSGKSTWVNEYVHQYPEFIVVCPDQLRMVYGSDVNDQSVNNRVWAIAKDQIIAALQKKQNVILDATNVNGPSRRKFLKEVKEKTTEEFSIKFIVFHYDPTESYWRIQKDLTHKKNRANISLKILQRMAYNYMLTMNNNIQEECNEILYYVT